MKGKEMNDFDKMCSDQINLSTACDTAQRAGLLDRVRDKKQYAMTQASHAGSLKELEDLLQKNPDVARILDLLDEVL